MTRRSIGLAIAVALLAGLAGLAAAADPTTPPTPRPGSCAERYPEEGPAGLDLRLGCIANGLVTHYLGGDAGQPVRISTYLTPLAVLVAGLVLVLLAASLVRRRAGARLAPASPGAYWLCPDCSSVNEPTRATCYSCQRPWSSGAAVMPAAQNPEMVQRFGGDRKSGPD